MTIEEVVEQCLQSSYELHDLRTQAQQVQEAPEKVVIQS